MTNIESLSVSARAMANALFGSEETVCSEQRVGENKKPSCITQEEERPLTKAEKLLGWARRPFWAYDPLKMCMSCQAYFYAERAAQVLHELNCLQIRAAAIAAAEKRKEPTCQPPSS